MSAHLALFAGSSHAGPLALFIVLLGIILFIVGFRTYREYRILEDTPLIPVRSVPMGLVHVSGKCTGDNLLTSPVTKVPCYYYKAELEVEVQKGKSRGWEGVGADVAEVPFYLDDASGKILVNPTSAEYDVLRSFQGELRTETLLSSGSVRCQVDESLSVPVPTEEYLRAYMNGPFRQASAARLGQMRAALKSSHTPGGQVLDVYLSQGESRLAAGFSRGAYRLTEHCLVAGRVCNVLGTCTENPAPADEHDRNLIKRGNNEKTFLITTKTERQIEKSLRRRALFLVVLGAALIVGGFALALASAGML
ncbi:MAG: GIDE domain-containing protein [Terriglobia bacterium]|jgi:hypothetical protein